ncbi:MAG: ankyrin repeat domain-containing protein [Rhodanobacteraceae bacterium]|nr:ankyrin repeat domain-containing protein [Rhodanobacteraceae bacterium]MBL0040228.1 ankyrin repeat domain-containing protein [Xanthomonadales bacterium]
MNDVLRVFFDELLALGASFDDRIRLGPMERDASGDMPLHYAAYQGRVDIVLALIAAGAPINAAGETGYTPLHYAIERGRSEVVLALMASGADPSLCDATGRSARVYAEDLGNLAVIVAVGR